MNDVSSSNDKPELTVAEAAAREVPGPQLRSARERLGLTVGDVAQSIKFSPRQIDALERDDLAALPPGTTFVRGFIRSYAKLLKIDSAPLLDMLQVEVPVATPELAQQENLGTRLPLAGQKRNWLPGLAVAALAVAVVALGTHYFYRGDLDLSSTHKSAPALPDPVVVSPPTKVPANVAPAAPAIMPTTSAVAPAVAPALAPAVVAPGHQMVFTFDDKAWVEVRDASQRVIFEQINFAGNRQVVGGKPPFQLVIGNASKFHLQYDGKPVDLEPETRAEVARLTLE